MTLFGSHYRVQSNKKGVQHVIFDLGMGVLAAHGRIKYSIQNRAEVQVARVGIFKDIVVLNYGHMSIVLKISHGWRKTVI